MTNEPLEQTTLEAQSEPSDISDPRNVLDLLRDLKQKRLNPKDLAVEERRACVAHLGGEGVSVPEMAALLTCSERTIARDRKAILEGRALKNDPELAGEVAGELLHQARVGVEHIRRATRDKSTPPAVRIDGERAAMEILDKTAHRLQIMGFLPSSAQQIEATLSHRLEDPLTLQEIYAEAKRVGCIELPNGMQERRYGEASKGVGSVQSLPTPPATGKVAK
ncbi:hypothetical protein [Algisphaera agarilytica]|uniref:Uncharacterized protein n=1 Tax=Algisphaera agarilytica TaxID=1385975 RepID=A0A7X0LJT5_9BACT|nr:hypothetical protein [Algisphaera agarilytica]MBB6429104.1 hypothetical protein [Algisphaera agarilytica]